VAFLTIALSIALDSASSGVQTPAEFSADSPIEIRATQAAVAELLAEHADEDYLLFPEDRRRPIRMSDALPRCWIDTGPGDSFQGQAHPGEFYVFQVGLFAARKTITDIRIEYSGLKGPSNRTISGSLIHCINLEGTDWKGQWFTRQVDVKGEHVQSFWIGIPIPAEASGRYYGELIVRPAASKAKTVKLIIDVGGNALADHGDSELWRHSRLRWLDSTVAIDDQPTEPYPPVKLDANVVCCLGRRLTFSQNGLPKSIVSTYTASVDSVEGPGREILAAPVSLVVETGNHDVTFAKGQTKVISQTPSAIAWEADSSSGAFSLHCRASMEFDGYVAYQLKLQAKCDIDVKDIRLEIPFKRDVAKYLMGMNHTGGLRPSEVKWKWDQNKHQDSIWIGDINAGLRCQLKGPDFVRPLVNIYYKYKKLNLPAAWYNDGRGGCNVGDVGGDRVVLTAYSGPRTIKANATLSFYFDLLLTPVKPINFAAHWRNRYYHNGGGNWKSWLSAAKEGGANVINIHHGNDLNPYINYPFHADTVSDLKAYIKDVHKEGLKAKIYYTVRELSNHVAELWALRSLGDEIFAVGGGNIEKTLINPRGADPWLQRHLRTGYIPAWRHVFRNGKYQGHVDAAIVTNGMSRWHNYYLEGLKWLAQNVEIDGIYIDDVAYDRVVMQRVRKILDRHRPGSLIDVHSWNHFNGHAGWTSNANLYMEHFPYVDSIWFGEGFNYNESPDYWLIEISGIPYGLTGEMLQGGGNPWRGMIYGMTGRLPWSGNPSSMWKFWDEFGIAEAKLMGYWIADCPVRTNRKDVLATVYKKKIGALVSIASWAIEPISCRLKIDWNALGINSKGAKLTAPYIEGFQDAALFLPGDEILIAPGKGRLLILI
jgi:hypothetical protein